MTGCKRIHRLVAAALPAVLLSVVGSAGAQSNEPPRVDLGITQSMNAAGRAVVSHWMTTNAAGPKVHVTVYRQPGDVSCRADVRNPWPSGAEQLLFGVDQRTQAVWGPVVRTVEHKAGTWTVCGYVVNDDNPRFDLPYVVARTRATYTVTPERTVAPRTSWKLCPPARVGRVVSLQVNGSPTRSACRRARSATAAFAAQWNKGGARNNWGSGWEAARARHLPKRNAPPVRYSRLKAPSGVSYVCRERTTATATSTPLVVECGPYRWRFIVR